MIPNPFVVDITTPENQAIGLEMQRKLKKKSDIQLLKCREAASTRVQVAEQTFKRMKSDVPKAVITGILCNQLMKERAKEEQLKKAKVAENRRIAQKHREIDQEHATLSHQPIPQFGAMKITTPTLTPVEVPITVKHVGGKDSTRINVCLDSPVFNTWKMAFGGGAFNKLKPQQLSLDFAPPGQHNGRRLDLKKTFAEQGVTSGSTITMEIRPIGGGGKTPFRRKPHVRKGPVREDESSVSLGSESSKSRSVAEHEYKRGEDPDYDPTEDEGDEGDDYEFDGCVHEFCSRLTGICIDCGAQAIEVSANVDCEWCGMGLNDVNHSMCDPSLNDVNHSMCDPSKCIFCDDPVGESTDHGQCQKCADRTEENIKKAWAGMNVKVIEDVEEVEEVDVLVEMAVAEIKTELLASDI